MHIDSSYVFEGGDYDLQKLFAVCEITNEVKDLQDLVEEQSKNMWSMLGRRQMPELETGPQCNYIIPPMRHTVPPVWYQLVGISIYR